MLQGDFFNIFCNEQYFVEIWDKNFKKGQEEMDTYNLSDRKKEIIKTTWQYLLTTGLAHASIGELCRETKLAQSSLYHWFENKDDIWISAGKYGLSKVVDALIGYTLDNRANIRHYFDTVLDEVEKYKYELRTAIQLTTSPVFGERMRDKAKDFRFFYDKYANELVSLFGCSYADAETFIYSIISFVVDYAIWDDREKTQMLLENLYERTVNKLQK